MSLKLGPRYKEGQTYDIKAAYFDVDNTLVANESSGVPSAEFVSCARDVKERVAIGLATARPYQKVAHILEAIEAKGYSILCNGAQIYDGRGHSFVSEKVIPLPTCHLIIDHLSRLPLYYWINDDGIDYFPDTSGGFGYQEDIWDRNSPLISAPDYEIKKPFIVVLDKLTSQQIEEMSRFIDECKDPEVTSFIAHQTKKEDGDFAYDMFITHRHANKADALQEVMRLQGFGKEHTLGVGDGRNDAVMLEATVGVALENAAEETKAVATFIAPSRADNGALIALEFFLNQ